MSGSKKNSPVAERSKTAMANALIEIMKQKGYNKISIKEICEKADVVRQTFYTNFKTKDDILIFYIDKNVRTFVDKKMPECSSLSEVIYEIFLFCEKSRDDIETFKKNGLEGLWLERLIFTNEEFRRCFGRAEKPETYGRYASAFYAGALYSVALCWLDNGLDISPRQLSEVMVSIIKNNDIEGIINS